MILQIVNPFDSDFKYESYFTINTQSKGVTSIDLTYNINQPNFLECVFNTNLPLEAYYAIKDNDYGLRIQNDDHDLLFIQDKSSKKVDSQGQISVNFYSSIYKALYSEPNIIQQQYINSSGIVTTNLVNGFEFTLISQDVTINLSTGINNNLDIIDEIRKASGAWSYFDAGLKAKGDGTYSNQILIGNYNDIDKFGAIDSRFATEQLQSNNVRNIFNKNPVLINVTSFSNGRKIKYLYPFLDTGQGGGSVNSTKVFTRTNYSFIDPYYPLVEINGKIYIQDVSYKGLEERFFVYPVTLTANSDDGEGQQTYDNDDALAYLYRKSVFYYKSQKESTRLDCDIAFKKLTFPKYLHVNYKKTIRNKNKKYVIHDINRKMLYKQLKFDLTKI